MLYDQSPAGHFLCRGLQLTGRIFREHRARPEYVLREMTHPEGAFSAEDADSLISHGRPEMPRAPITFESQETLMFWARRRHASSAATTEWKRGAVRRQSDPHGEFRVPCSSSQDAATTAGSGRQWKPPAARAKPRKLFAPRAASAPHLDDTSRLERLMISPSPESGAAFSVPRYLNPFEKPRGFTEESDIKRWPPAELARRAERGLR
jgi:hypothetical protein